MDGAQEKKRKAEGDSGVFEPWTEGLSHLRQGRSLGSRFGVGGRSGFTAGPAGLEKSVPLPVEMVRVQLWG